MTMTESPPVSETALPAASPRVVGLFDALTTTDHKRIGRLWLRSGLLMLLAGTVLGVVLSIENSNSSPDDLFGGVNSFFQYFSLYRFGLVLLVVAPLFVGIATVIVPMQVGATNIAFPRAAHSAVWLFMIGAGTTVVSVVAGGGWGALDGVSSGERDAIALTLVGTALVIASILLASVCIATTVVSLRTSGMNLLRVPLFAWSMLVATSVWLLTLPVALSNLALIYFDLRGGPGTFGTRFDTAEDAGAVYTQLGWLFEQPQIYAFAIPVLGILGQFVPVIARRRHAQHVIAVALIGLFGLLSVGGWSQPFFQGGSHDEKFIFIAFGLFAALPVLGSIGGAVATIAKRSGAKPSGAKPSDERGPSDFSGFVSVHGLGAIGAGLLLLAATVAGLARVIEPFDLGGRTTVTAVMNLVLYSAVVAAIAGVWFWAPKISGNKLPDSTGRLVIVDLVAGALLLSVADFVNGFLEVPAFQYQVPFDPAQSVLVAEPSNQGLVDLMNVISALGAVLIALGVLGVFAALAKAARAGEPVADNPFGGQSLEWATSSPPPSGNFSEPPGRVASEAPLLDAHRDNREEA